MLFPHQKRLRRLVTIALAFSIPLTASAQTGSFITGGPASIGAPDGIRSAYTAEGYLRFLGAGPGNTIAVSGAQSTDPVAVALQFVSERAQTLYDGNNSVSFAVKKVKRNAIRTYVHLQQQYQSLRVFGAEIMVQVASSGGVEAALSDILRDSGTIAESSRTSVPSISEADAVNAGIDFVIDLYGVQGLSVTPPELLLYAPEVIGNSGPPVLAWYFEVVDGETVREAVFVEATRGQVVNHYTLLYTALSRAIHDANNTTANPGTLVRSEGDPPVALADANQAYDFLGITYAFYAAEHGRDGIQNTGATLISTVRACDPFFGCPMANAFWDGTRMAFGEGFAIDDVAGHELTHGVTEAESGLIYMNQSGALNESFSDIWGEFIDLANPVIGSGVDDAANRWLIGENVPGFGAIRDMEDPNVFGHPATMSDPLFFTGPGDNGGVHINSGVGNKLCFLLTDGATFNGETVTGMGISKVADLFYECQVNLLTSGSDYYDFYVALQQAALNLGFTLPERANVLAGSRAVEIDEIDGVPPTVCLSDSVYGQMPVGLGGPWNSYTSDTGLSFKVYDNYDIDSPDIVINDVHWWGINAHFPNDDFTPCERTPDAYQISFYQDNAGTPGTLDCSYSVTPTKVNTGLIYTASNGNNFPLYRYDVDLPTPCALTSGWISIQGINNPNCLFLWMESPTGDNIAYQNEESLDTDLAFCLTGFCNVAAYSENFEGGFTGGTMSGLWHTTNACAAALPNHSATTALYFGVDANCDYNTGSTATGLAVTPPINLLAATPPASLNFNYLLGTEDFSGFDVASVEISTDGGSNWTVLADNAGGAPEQLADTPNAWASRTLDISSFIGNTVIIGFRFNSVDTVSNDFPGFYVDDVEVVACGIEVQPCPAPAVPSNPSPAHNATGVGIAPTLMWDGGLNGDPCDPVFDVFFGTAPGSLSKIFNDLTIEQCAAPGPLAPDTVYYWRVFAANGVDITPSPVFSFRTWNPANGAQDPVWVDFGYGGAEFGTQAQPFNTFAEGGSLVLVGGTVNIKPGTTSEAPRVTKAMRLDAPSGGARIGDATP